MNQDPIRTVPSRLAPRIDVVVGLLLAVLAFSVYCLTLSRTVGWEDNGEIATSLYTLGIVHPTGYPTFTMLGWAFSHLPIGGTVIWRLNLLVAILTSASVFFFFRLFLFLLSERARPLFASRGRKMTGATGGNVTAPSSIDLWAASAATLVLAFSRTFWSEGISLEVYAFHLLLLSVVTTLFLKALLSELAQPLRRDRDWRVFAFALGLGFTNHMMMVLLAPAYLLLFFRITGWSRRAWQKILQAIPLFAVGLLPYLYLYIRSAQKPLLNWGDPSTARALWQHVTGFQYHQEMFASTQVATHKFGEFFQGFPGQFAYAPLLLALLGIGVLWKRSRVLLAFAVLIFLGCLGYAINHNFQDPNYYLNAYVAFALVTAWGAKGLLEAAARRQWYVPVLLATVIISLFPLALNYRDMDLSRDTTADDFARNMLASVEPNGILFAQEEQIFLFPALYLQVVEKVRTDVIVLNGIWFSMPWYHQFMEVWAPDALNRERARLRPTFATQGTPLQKNVTKIPEGLVWHLYLNADSNPTPRAPIEMRFNPITGRNIYKDLVRAEYGFAFHNQGYYRGFMVGDTALGIRYFQKALEMMPGYGPSVEGLQRLGAAQGGMAR